MMDCAFQLTRLAVEESIHHLVGHQSLPMSAGVWCYGVCKHELSKAHQVRQFRLLRSDELLSPVRVPKPKKNQLVQAWYIASSSMIYCVILKLISFHMEQFVKEIVCFTTILLYPDLSDQILKFFILVPCKWQPLTIAKLSILRWLHPLTIKQL